jgi:hypothetical protein
MFSQQTNAPKIVEKTLPKELQLRYFLEPEIVHASWAVKKLATEHKQGNSWSR